jgi:serine/threonine-protein kinase
MTFDLGPYLVMEYLEGTTLAALLEQEGRLSPTRAVDYILQVCEALIAAHKAGVVHRDIKPENLFIVHQAGRETVKLVDFGICSGPLVSHGSRRGSPLYGTPAYMAPERLCDDDAADHRADIWSIGVVLHELVTGQGLFEADTLAEICAKILCDEPVVLEPDDALLPARLRAIIRRCVSRDPERRYPGVEHLVVALTPHGTLGAAFRARTPGATPHPSEHEPDAPASDASPEPPGPIRVARSSSRSAIACGALLVLGLVAGLRFLLPLADAGDAASTAHAAPEPPIAASAGDRAH